MYRLVGIGTSFQREAQLCFHMVDRKNCVAGYQAIHPPKHFKQHQTYLSQASCTYLRISVWLIADAKPSPTDWRGIQSATSSNTLWNSSKEFGREETCNALDASFLLEFPKEMGVWNIGHPLIHFLLCPFQLDRFEWQEPTEYCRLVECYNLSCYPLNLSYAW